MTTAVAGSGSGEFALGSLGASTGWLPLIGLADDPSFGITGTFVATIELQVSYQADYAKTRYTTKATYAAAQAPTAIPRNAARYFRLIVTAYTSGIAYVGVSEPNRAGQDGTPSPVSPQMKSSGPGVDYFMTPTGDAG